MKKLCFLLFLGASLTMHALTPETLSGHQSASIEVTGQKVENMSNPLGLDTDRPRFSWIIESHGKQPEKDVVQTAYRIIVSSSSEKLQQNVGDLWDSGEVDSEQQLWVPYAGLPLRSNQHAYWKVRVKTNKGDSDWNTQQHTFSTGLLGETSWGGRWIGLERLMPGEEAGVTHSRLAARYLRKEFSIKKKVKRATAFIAGLGLYRLYINGHLTGNDELTPIPSDYRKTIYYDTYDVTDLIGRDSVTAIGITLGNGRFFAPRQDKPYKNNTFGLPKCRMNLILEYEDGSTQRLVTDETWRVSANGPISANNEYDGEQYDARKELGAWTMPYYDDSQWMQAERSAIPTGTLRGRVTPGMKATGPIRPTDHIGSTILDFGQNLAGWVSLAPKGKAGDTIRIRYAEQLNEDGTLYTDNLRDARSEDIYICNGKNGGKWHPSFVTHGFRYVEVSGPATDFQAYAVSDEMASIGHFACSDTILNKVVRNAWWGICSNYKGMPVDCPQRNERQPWLGDRTVGALGESFLFDNERLYTKWMRDICEAQREDGCIPDVAPAFWNYYTDDVTWPAALPFNCEMLKEQYGNDEALRLWRPNIERWLHHIVDRYTSKDGLITKDKYGDWCVPPEKLELIHSEDPARKTDGSLIATAYAIKCMELLGEPWQQLRQQYIEAFNRRFLTNKPGTSLRPGHPLYPDSIYYGNNTATSNLLPLAFGICPDSLRDEVAKQIVENIVVKNDKGHVSCGVIGISWLLRTLSDCGYGDVAYLLATQRTYPSWGYMTEQGATTIWELWNGDHANPAMNSGNHVMLLGDLLTWCFQQLGGLQSSDACKHITLKPDFSIQDCDSVNCSYLSPYGLVKSRWKKNLLQLQWEVSIPCNTTATLHFPDGTTEIVGSGNYTFKKNFQQQQHEIIDEALIRPGAQSCHASTIVETRKGELVVAYFAGTYERHPDCNIYVHVKEKDKDWGPAILAADGEGNACWNPVLTEMPNGELWLFYKVGKAVKDWKGWLTKSRDGGHSWSKPEPLPDSFLGPIKNKPLLLGNKLICGSSTEDHGWRFHVEILDLKTNEWRYVGPVESTIATKTDDNQPHPIDCIQPSLLQLSDGRLMVLMRTHNARLAQSFSSDGGETWTPVTLSSVENNQSGTDAVTLKDGGHVLIYNNFETLPNTKKGPRTPLSLAKSEDGMTWHHWLTLESSASGEFSYPAIIQGRDGSLHCVYTWRRQRIAYKRIHL